MRGTVTTIGFILLCLAQPALGQPNPLPDEFVAAWKKAAPDLVFGLDRPTSHGFSNFDEFQFAGRAKGLPAFRLRKAPVFLQVPVSDVPFSVFLSNATDESLKVLSAFPNMQALHINNTMNMVSDKGMKHVAALKNLRSFTLHSLTPGAPNVSTEGFKELAELKDLQVLWLLNTEVGDAGMEMLGKLKGLTSFQINNAKLTDKSMKHVAELQNLKVLLLNNNPITDDGLVELASLKQLELLRLDGTKTTEKGISLLHASLRKCVIKK